MKKTFYLFSILVSCCLFFLAACGEGSATQKTEAKDTVEAEAEEEEEEEISEEFVYANDVYQKNCTSCHEKSVKKFIKRAWKNGNSWNEVHQSIVKGHGEVAMADFVKALPDSAFEKITDFMLICQEQVTAESFVEQDLSGVIETEGLKFKLDTVVRGLKIPWGVSFLPNGDILVTDRNGQFYRQEKDGDLKEITGLPEIRVKGQGGLLDVKAHPNFAQNQTIYLSFSKPKGEKEATTAVLKAQLKNDKLVNSKVIFEALPYHDARHHFGSRLEFDNDGYLYVSVGDRLNRDTDPQDLSKQNGKIHRIKDDGSIPADNPFVNTPNAKASIWSYGQRNPQGLAYDKETGIMWESEHAPRGGDEINIIQKGANYGWPLVSFGINYKGTRFTDLIAKEGMTQPQYYYVPSTGTCGLAVVSGDNYPAWKGDLLAGSLRYGYLSRLKVEGTKVVGEERLLEKVGRLRDVKMGNDGYIYIAVENPGFVFRLMPVKDAI